MGPDIRCRQLWLGIDGDLFISRLLDTAKSVRKQISGFSCTCHRTPTDTRDHPRSCDSPANVLILQDQNSIAVFTDQESLPFQPVQPVRASRSAPSAEEYTFSVDAPGDGMPGLDEEVSVENVRREREVLSLLPNLSLSMNLAYVTGMLRLWRCCKFLLHAHASVRRC